MTKFFKFSFQSCAFQKQSDNTVLRVVWNGNLKVSGASACRRWYFTINDVECQTPATVDAQLHARDGDDIDIRPAFRKHPNYISKYHYVGIIYLEIYRFTPTRISTIRSSCSFIVCSRRTLSRCQCRHGNRHVQHWKLYRIHHGRKTPHRLAINISYHCGGTGCTRSTSHTVTRFHLSLKRRVQFRWKSDKYA